MPIDTSALEAQVKALNALAAKEIESGVVRKIFARKKINTEMERFLSSKDNLPNALALARYGSDDLKNVIFSRIYETLDVEFRMYLVTDFDWNAALQDPYDPRVVGFFTDPALLETMSFTSRNYSDKKPIPAAIKNKRPDALKIFLQRGANPNQCAYLHHLAAQDGDENYEMFRLLLAEGADPLIAIPPKNNTIFHIAAENGNLRVLRDVIAWCRDKAIPADYFTKLINARNAENVTPLRMATSGGHASLVSEILPYSNVSIDERDAHDRTLLTIAVLTENKNKDVVEALVSAGANTNIADENGYTPLHYAAGQDLEEIAKLLLEHGADINAATKDGVTALHSAVSQGREKMVRFLIKNGTDINIADAGKHTPLHASLIRGNRKMAKLLVDEGANTSTVNNNNLTAPQVIAFANDADELLLEAIPNTTERKNFIKASRAKAIIGMAYNEDEFSFALLAKGRTENAIDAYALLNQAISEIDFPQRDLFLDVIKKSFDGALIPTPQGNIGLLKIPYDDHASYFIIEYDEHNVPCRLSYCDGNLPLEDESDSPKHGEISFDIDPEKLKSVAGDFGEFLKKSFSDAENKIFAAGSFSRSNFDKALTKIAVCDADGKPKIVARNIPTKAQNRGNCGFKALNILFRAVMRRVDPAMVFEVDAEGKNCGAGYEAYQKYKKTLIKKHLENLLELSDPSHKDECYYLDVIKTLKDPIFLNALAKSDFVLLEKLAKIFAREGIDLSEIKNKEGRNAWFSALNNGDEKVFDWCRDKEIKMEKDSDGFYPIHLTGFNEDKIKLLLSHGADINAVGKNGNTVLANAMIVKKEDLTKFLMERNAEIIFSEKSFNPILVATIHGWKEIVETLINRGTSVDAANDEGMTALMMAVKLKNLEMAKFLLEKNCDLLIADVHGNTAFHFAVASKDLEMVKLLAEHGAANDLPNKNGETPQQMAEKNGIGEELAMILSESPATKIPATETVPMSVAAAASTETSEVIRTT